MLYWSFFPINAVNSGISPPFAVDNFLNPLPLSDATGDAARDAGAGAAAGAAAADPLLLADPLLFVFCIPVDFKAASCIFLSLFSHASSFLFCTLAARSFAACAVFDNGLITSSYSPSSVGSATGKIFIGRIFDFFNGELLSFNTFALAFFGIVLSIWAVNSACSCSGSDLNFFTISLYNLKHLFD